MTNLSVKTDQRNANVTIGQYFVVSNEVTEQTRSFDENLLLDESLEKFSFCFSHAYHVFFISN